MLIVANSELQPYPNPQSDLRIPKLSRTTPPQGNSGAVAQAARMPVAAERLLIITEERLVRLAGMKLMIELAETHIGSIPRLRDRQWMANREIHALRVAHRSLQRC